MLAPCRDALAKLFLTPVSKRRRFFSSLNPYFSSYPIGSLLEVFIAMSGPD